MNIFSRGEEMMGLVWSSCGDWISCTWMSVAVVGSILNGDEEGDEVVTDDEKDQQKQTVPYEHVEKRETEAQEF